MPEFSCSSEQLPSIAGADSARGASRFRSFRATARRSLAAGAEVAAPSRNNRAPDQRPAAKALFPFALVDAMPPLKPSALAVRIHVVGNGRSAQVNRFRQHLANRAIKLANFVVAQICAQPRRMNPRSPQTFIGVNVPHAAHHMLIEKQRLDSRAPPQQRCAKFIFARFERINPCFAQKSRAFAPPIIRICPNRLTSV